MTRSARIGLLRVLVSASVTLASLAPASAQSPAEAARLDAIDALVAECTADGSMNPELASKLQAQTAVIRKELGEGDRAEAVAKAAELSGKMIDEGLSKPWITLARANQFYDQGLSLNQALNAPFHFEYQILSLRSSVNSYAGTGEIASEFAKTLRGELIVLRDEMRAHDLKDTDSKAVALSSSTLPLAASQGAISSDALESLTSQLEYIRYALYYAPPCDERYGVAIQADDHLAGEPTFTPTDMVKGHSAMVVNKTPHGRYAAAVPTLQVINDFAWLGDAYAAASSGTPLAVVTAERTFMNTGYGGDLQRKASRYCAELHTYIEIAGTRIVDGKTIRAPIAFSTGALPVLGSPGPFAKLGPIVGSIVPDNVGNPDSFQYGYKWVLNADITTTFVDLYEHAGQGKPGGICIAPPRG